MPTRFLRLGLFLPLDGAHAPMLCELSADHRVTHGVVTGMTGSGNTGHGTGDVAIAS